MSTEDKGRWLSRKENMGLIVGPLLFVATILTPVASFTASSSDSKDMI
ncbi:MAG TPA: hypothetical protein VKA87_01895 [Nitrososphaeraceae archaeon]|nr:hypothetical protein [Nitrososphaeraceae archaeon]